MVALSVAEEREKREIRRKKRARNSGWRMALWSEDEL